MTYQELEKLYDAYSKTLDYYPHQCITVEGAEDGLIEWEQHPDYILEAYEAYVIAGEK